MLISFYSFKGCKDVFVCSNFETMNEFFGNIIDQCLFKCCFWNFVLASQGIQTIVLLDIFTMLQS